MDDLVQDVFVKVYSNRDRMYRLVPAYLMIAATHASVDYLRWKARHCQAGFCESVDERTPYDSLAARESRNCTERVLRGVAELPWRQREALEAYLCSGNMAAAARTLSIPYSTLRSRKDAAVENLRTLLPGDLLIR